MLGNPNSSGTAYLMLASLVQVFGEDEAFKYMKALNANVSSYARSGIGPMTAVKQRRDLRRQHGAARRDQRDRRAASRSSRCCPARASATKSARWRSSRARATSTTRRSSSTGRSPSTRRRSGSRSRSTRSRPTRTCRCRRWCRTSTDIKVINYDFAKYGSSETRKRLLERWEKEIAPSAAMTGHAPRAAASGSPSARSGFLLVPWYALQDSVFALGWIAQFATKDSGAGAAAGRRCTARAWLAPLGVAARRRRSRSRALTLGAQGARERADRRRRGRLRLPARRRASRSARRAGTSSRSPRRCRALPRGQYGMGLGAALVAHVVRACCSRWGSPAAATSRAIAFVAGSVVARRRAGRRVHVLPGRPDPDLGAAGQRTARSRSRRFAERLFTEKIWGLGCIVGSTRCGVAWNTLMLALLVRDRLHGARPRVRADRDAAPTFRAQEGCCASSSVLPIITPPFVIGLGLILIFGRSGLVNQLLEYAVRLAARALDLRPAGRAASRRCSRSRRSPSSC